MHIRRFNHLALLVAELGVSLSFYEQVLGLNRLSRPDFDFPGAWLALGEGQELHLIEGRTEPVSPAGSRSNHLALEVGDIQEAAAELSGRGISYRPPKQRPDGAWQLFVNDPDGYCIELLQIAIKDNNE